ncbi:alpha/beta hydrolase [Ralstonia solanacearum]|uniref:alpha/beta hydrolase n=1 Tax=Ralstonia solanacearum TaxID=305 RepID=UPI0007C95684|nr:alpha/beta hydrolase [Ralstonia solanacearum]OAI74590.1 DeoR family transcriptional regulator [Ralstonia solanacearum]QNT25791.1 alpha/beta hydrolase [Ralstonia solanacearum]QNT62844.1 alpha/beta hydrolase [Ralstonia solanacearum]QNT63409.1 alpha/beta hydrolase [Ralstonia solanacearum]
MIQQTSFPNRDVTLSAHLHLPDDFREDAKYPALVGVHPAGGVKEQTIGLYAKRLATKGFVVVVYDSTYQGASGGEPRLLEDPSMRVEDARCAADFLSTLSYVDVERMGVFGVCAGGGYALAAAQTERRFKAVAGVSATPMGEAARTFFGRAIPVPELIGSLEAAAHARTAQARGGDPVYMPFVPEKFEDITADTPTMLREGYDYYRTPRGQHPNSKGRFLMTSLDKMLAFTTFHLIPSLLTQPMLLVAGSEADTKIYSDQAFALSNGPKELFVIDGATHIALYDIPQYVDQAAPKLAAFFAEHLAPKTAG